MKTQRVFVRQPEPITPIQRLSCVNAVQTTLHILSKSAARMPVDFVKALLNHNDKGVTGIYAR
jgi:hypothetical protein